MAAAPVDAWWHATFGKDVLTWSPPHLQLHLGAGVAAIGLLFAVAAQRGRGALASAWLWRGAMLAVLVDLVHRGHFILAHYTMLSHARTPDLYPFLVALLVPVVLRSEEHTSELQSLAYLVCRLLLEKKKKETN